MLHVLYELGALGTAGSDSVHYGMSSTFTSSRKKVCRLTMLPGRGGLHGSAGKRKLRHEYVAILLLQQQPQKQEQPAIASFLPSFLPSLPPSLLACFRPSWRLEMPRAPTFTCRKKASVNSFSFRVSSSNPVPRIHGRTFCVI